MKNKTRSSKKGGARAAYKYKSKSKPTTTTNTSIKYLPDDVMKYSMGFIRPALDNKSIRKVSYDYLEGGPNKKKAIIETYGKIENWDTSRVTDMSGLFSFTSFNEDISKWDVSNVTTMKDMFGDNRKFNQPIGKWGKKTGNVTDMHGMFDTSENFNQPIEDWDVSKVTDMSHMFDHADKFNRPINKWDVSNVTNLKWMFCAKKFNKRLTTWGDKLPRNADISYMFGYKKWDIVKKIAPWYYKLLKKQTINSLLGL
jgi:surface protein